MEDEPLAAGEGRIAHPKTSRLLSGRASRRRPRAGVLTGIDTLLAGRAGGDSAASAEPTPREKAPHQTAQRWRNSLRSPRRLLSRPRIALPIAVLVLGGAALGGWAVTRPTASTAATQRVIPALRTTMRQTLSSTGTIEPATTSTLSFAASGQVTAVDAKVGQHVTEGQALAIMYSAALKAQVAQAEAGLAGDQSRLSQDQASSASSAQLAADQASVNADQSQVDSANTALGGATLTSPIDGIVTTVGLTTGQQVSGGSDSSSGGGSDSSGSSGESGGGDSGSGGGDSGSGSGSSTSSITVISANDVINASVNATVVGQIKAGDQAVITPEGAAGAVRGTVASIGLTADTSSGVATFPVVIDVTGTPSGLYAGASATVSIIYHQVSNALVVPTAAIRPSGGGKTVVYTMVGGHRVARDVTTGLTSGGLTQITSGLTAGERVVVVIPRAVSTGGSGSGNTFIGPRGRVIQINGGSGFGPAGGLGG